MEIAVIGISHKEATVSIRGLLSFTTTMKEKATKELLALGLLEFMIISTCNRSEIYIGSNNMHKDIEVVKSYYIKIAGPKILPYIFVKKYEDAMQHIFRVATGLDSLIIGEDEILGQMKRALSFAVEKGSSKKYLTKVVREGITFSKKVRYAYKLSENQTSVASIGIKYLKDFIGTISDKKILLIGTGVMGQLILRYLEQENNPNIYLTNRTFNKDKVKYYVDKSINLIEYSQRYDIIKDMDIVISATASPHTVVKKACLLESKGRTLYLDMAVPRDIDPLIDQLDDTKVITMDDLNTIANQHMSLRKEVANQINRLILEEVKELELWILRAKVDSVIKEFHDKQKRIISANTKQIKELGLSIESEKKVNEIIRRSTWEMIKEPVEQLKSLKEIEEIDHYKMILEKLFDFESGEG